MWFKKKIIQWNHNFKQTVEKFKTFSKAVEEIVEFINDINEYLQKENINDLVKFISKTIKNIKDELIKKPKTTYFNKIIKDLLDGFEKTIDFISESNNELTYLHLNKKEIIKSMNFDKLQSELKVTLLKLNDEIEKNTKIEEENIKLNDENIKLNQNFESIIKTLNQLQNDMIIVKKESKDKSEEIKRLNDDLKDKSEEIKRLNEDSKKQSNEIKKNKKEIKRLNDDLNDKSEEIKRLNNVLNIQKEINTNLQKQINEKEKEKLVEENKNLREDYDKILSFFNN